MQLSDLHLAAVAIINNAPESERWILSKAFISLFESADPEFNVGAFNRACRSGKCDYWYVSGIGVERQAIAYEVRAPNPKSAVAGFLYKSGASETINDIQVEETFDS